jgi:hypothetical protein
VGSIDRPRAMTLTRFAGLVIVGRRLRTHGLESLSVPTVG